MKGKRLVFGCISNTLKVKISSVFQIYQISFFLLCHFSELVKYCLAEFFRQGTPAPWQNFFARKIWGNWGVPPPLCGKCCWRKTSDGLGGILPPLLKKSDK